MSEKEIKKKWLSIEKEVCLEIDNDKLFDDIKSFNRRIKTRNYIELFSAIAIVLFMGVFLFKIDPIISKIGIFIIIITSILVAFRLYFIKSKNNASVSVSLKDSLTNSIRYLELEASLLQTVLIWYAFPFNVGLIIFFAGFGINLMFFIMVGFVLAFTMFVKYYNDKALKSELYPLIKDIKRNLTDLND